MISYYDEVNKFILKGIIMLIALRKCIILFIFLLLPIAIYAFDSFDCVGSAPFWKLTLTEEKFIFMADNLPPINLSAVQPTPAENMKMEHLRVYRTIMNGKNIVILLQKQSCTEGESMDIFPYEGIIITDDKVFHGCCSKKLVLTR